MMKQNLEPTTVVWERGKESPIKNAKIVVVPACEPREFLPLLDSFAANHVLQSARDDIDKSSKLARRLESGGFLKSSELEKFWLESEPASVEFGFDSIESKNMALEQLVNFVNRSSRLIKRLRHIEMIASELMLNAVLSSATAYGEMTGKQFNFEKGTGCVIRMAFDDDGVVLTCVDPLGSLRRESLITRLQELFNGNAIEVSAKHAGQSGIGCKVIMDHSTDFFAASERLKRTMVGCRLLIKGSGAVMEKTPKNFHIVTQS